MTQCACLLLPASLFGERGRAAAKERTGREQLLARVRFTRLPLLRRRTANSLSAHVSIRVSARLYPQEYLMDPRFAAPEQYIMSTQARAYMSVE